MKYNEVISEVRKQNNSEQTISAIKTALQNLMNQNEEELRRQFDLPIKKELVYYKSRFHEESKRIVKKITVDELYDDWAVLKCIFLPLNPYDIPECRTIHCEYLKEMQIKDFVEKSRNFEI